MKLLVRCKAVLTLIAVILPALLLDRPAAGQLLTFYGLDPGFNPGGARPNADAAAAAFDAAASALGPVHIIDFENLPAGSGAPLMIDAGVSLTHTGYGSANILDAPSMNQGYNTTAGGSKWLFIFPAQILNPTPELPILPDITTFDFTVCPIQAFGAFFTEVGTVPSTIEMLFNDGTDVALPIVGDPTGGVLFLGFIDPGKSITQVIIREPAGQDFGDNFGIDDIRYVCIPEPSTLALLFTGGLPLVGRVMRRRRTGQDA
jgi:hypothetical protein